MVNKVRYNQVLSNPEDSDKEMIAQLIAQYPYSQPLRFLHAQKQHEEKLKDPLADALLYTGVPLWLYERTTIAQPTDEAIIAVNYYIGEQPDEVIDEQEE